MGCREHAGLARCRCRHARGRRQFGVVRVQDGVEPAPRAAAQFTGRLARFARQVLESDAAHDESVERGSIRARQAIERRTATAHGFGIQSERSRELRERRARIGPRHLESLTQQFGNGGGDLGPYPHFELRLGTAHAALRFDRSHAGHSSRRTRILRGQEAQRRARDPSQRTQVNAVRVQEDALLAQHAGDGVAHAERIARDDAREDLTGAADEQRRDIARDTSAGGLVSRGAFRGRIDLTVRADARRASG